LFCGCCFCCRCWIFQKFVVFIQCDFTSVCIKMICKYCASIHQIFKC
jgi:hypothetical protein